MAERNRGDVSPYNGPGLSHIFPDFHATAQMIALSVQQAEKKENAPVTAYDGFVPGVIRAVLKAEKNQGLHWKM